MKTLAQPYEYEDLLIDAVYADRQVYSLREPDGFQNAKIRAFAAVVGASFDDALAEVRQITETVRPVSKLGVTRLDARKAVAHHIDAVLAAQAGEESATAAETTDPISTIVKTVPARGGLVGYHVHALRQGAPLPGGRQVSRVQDYGSDSHLLVVGSDGSELYLHRHTEIRELDNGVIRLAEPEYAGWAAD